MSFFAWVLVIGMIALLAVAVAVAVTVRQDGYGTGEPPRSHPDPDEAALLTVYRAG